MKVQKRQKARFICNFNGKSSFSLTQCAITQRRVITLGPNFTKIVLNQAQGSTEKSQEVLVRKMSISVDITKNIGGGGRILPRLF